MLCEKIVEAKNGDRESMQFLIEKFDPLIKAYGRKLGYEDAEQDMVVFLLELIRKIALENLKSQDDGSIIMYVKNAFQHQYVLLVKALIKRKKEIMFSQMSDEQNYKVEEIMSVELDTNSLKWLKGMLTEKEERVIILVYMYGYSSQEIADQLHISRQAVNQTKMRALKTMKEKLN